MSRTAFAAAVSLCAGLVVGRYLGPELGAPIEPDVPSPIRVFPSIGGLNDGVMEFDTAFAHWRLESDGPKLVKVSTMPFGASVWGWVGWYSSETPPNSMIVNGVARLTADQPWFRSTVGA